MKRMVVLFIFAIITAANLICLSAGRVEAAKAKAYEPPEVGVLLHAGVDVHEQVALRYELALPNIASAEFSASSTAGVEYRPHPSVTLMLLFGGSHQPGDNTFKVDFRHKFQIKRFFIFGVYCASVHFKNLFHFIQAGLPITEYLGLSLASEGLTKFDDVIASWVRVGPSVDLRFGKHFSVNAINMVGVERGRCYYVFRMYLNFSF